jgi:hypothetical protein
MAVTKFARRRSDPPVLEEPAKLHMCNTHSGFRPSQHALHRQARGFGIERGKGFVKNNQVGWLQQGSGKMDTTFFAV